MKKVILITGGLLLSGILAGCQSDDMSELNGKDKYVSPTGISDVETPKGENFNNDNTRGQNIAELESDDVETEKINDQIDYKIDSGRYQGRADSNFIEVAISGVPDKKAFRVFMLSEELKENFEGIGLTEGDNIKIKYYENENQQNIIVNIDKI